MTIPGDDILDDAFDVIDSLPVQYYRFQSDMTNTIGLDVPTYAAPVTIYGSLQSVDKALYEKYGLSLEKTYYVFFTSTNLRDIQRNVSNDYLVFKSKRYNCESAVENWFDIDGWVGMLCILQGDA